MEAIINKVANSGLISIDMEEWLPKGPFKEIDLKSILWQGLILREQDLKDFLSAIDYAQFEGSYLNVLCSEEVILPQWIYALISAKFSPFCNKITWGNQTDLFNELLSDQIDTIDVSRYTDQRIVVKGCSNVEIAPRIYMKLIAKLQPVAKSLMYGEPCSTVPLYKKKTNTK